MGSMAMVGASIHHSCWFEVCSLGLLAIQTCCTYSVEKMVVDEDGPLVREVAVSEMGWPWSLFFAVLSPGDKMESWEGAEA